MGRWWGTQAGVGAKKIGIRLSVFLLESRFLKLPKSQVSNFVLEF